MLFVNFVVNFGDPPQVGARLVIGEFRTVSNLGNREEMSIPCCPVFPYDQVTRCPEIPQFYRIFCLTWVIRDLILRVLSASNNRFDCRDIVAVSPSPVMTCVDVS